MIRLGNVMMFSICLLVLISCSGQEGGIALERGTAIITGKVSNIGEDTKAIRFATESTVEGIEQTVLMDSMGNFRVDIDLYHPQNVQGMFSEGSFKLLLGPFDSIHVEIDQQIFDREPSPIVNLSGTKVAVEVSRSIQAFARFRGDKVLDPDPTGLSVDEFHDILETEIGRQNAVLKEFCDSNKVAESFIEWAQKDLRYGLANHLVKYKMIHGKVIGDLMNESLFPINDDDAIITSYYPGHLRHFALNLGFWQDTVSLSLLEKGENVAAYQRCLNTIVSEVEMGLSRDIMCYKVLRGLLDNSLEDYEIVSQELDTYIDNEVLKSVLFEKVEDYKGAEPLDIAYLDPESNEEKEVQGDFWKELKQKYKGKVVYVDIWATWCGPCRAEVPHAIELHEYFKGEDIAFVNLCLASNKSDWDKMISNGNIEGDNYFFNKAQTQLLRNELRFSGYPTYMLIDKQGNLVNKDAARPSSKEEVRALLDEWIDR